MKGMVFTMLSDMVESEFGIDVWDALIDETSPESGGVYTSVEVYPDGELVAYVEALSIKLDVPSADLVRAFGKYLMSRFSQIHPEFFEGHDLKSFLMSVHDVIHVEVRKLHPGVLLPEFEYDDPGPDELVMRYISPRKLCALAEGLIEGAALAFGSNVTTRHDVCMHHGANHCELALSFAKVKAADAA